MSNPLWFDTLKEFENQSIPSAKPAVAFEDLIQLQEDEGSLPLSSSSSSKPVPERVEKRAASTNLEDTFEPKKRAPPESQRENQDTEEKNFVVLSTPKSFLPFPPLTSEQVISLIHTCATVHYTKLAPPEKWLPVIESLLLELDWRGLEQVLTLARKRSQNWFPREWLSLVFQTASRLVRDPQAVDQSFRGGAFKENPSAFFELGLDGQIRLGRHCRWGRLRGYTFCSWINLRKSDSTKPFRQLYRFGNTQTGAFMECSLMDHTTVSGSSTHGFTCVFRSRTSSFSSWTKCEAQVSLALNRWHFIVVGHARPYLLGKAKISLFVDGVQLNNVALSVPFPASKELDDCVLGSGLEGKLGSPTLFEGGDLTVQEANALCDRTRIRVEPLHDWNLNPLDKNDDEEDELTRGLGLGAVDAKDLSVDAQDFVKELANRVVNEEEKGKKKRMVFSFDPRVCAHSHEQSCPALVIRGMRSRHDASALELSPMQAGEEEEEDEEEDDAQQEGSCVVKVEQSVHRDCVSLSGGCRGLLLAVSDCTVSHGSDALMFLGDALHADAHLRHEFLSMEGFSLVNRMVRALDGQELVQVILHMIRAAPAGAPEQRLFFQAGVKELLLEPRVSQARAVHIVRLVTSLAQEQPVWIRETMGVDGLLRFLSRLEGEAEAQQDFMTEVFRPIFAVKITQVDMGLLCSYVAEHASTLGARFILEETYELIKSGNVSSLKSLVGLGGLSFLIRLGMFTERNVKNPSTGTILKNPDPLPGILGSSEVSVETKCILLKCIGLLFQRRSLACLPFDGSGLSEATDVSDQDMAVQMGHLLSVLYTDTFVENHEDVLNTLLEMLPKPFGFFTWAPLANVHEDAKGMARVADSLRRNPPLAKGLLSQRGWERCFGACALKPGPLGIAARSALVTVLSRSEEAKAVDQLVANTPLPVWGETIKTLILTNANEIAIPVLVRALTIARRDEFEPLSGGGGISDPDFVLSCLNAGEHVRTSTGEWEPLWAWIKHCMPSTESVEVAALGVKLAIALSEKELRKPPMADHRKRVLELLKLCAGKEESPLSSAGQLRSELCLGLVQTYPVSDNPAGLEKLIEAYLEQSDSVHQAVLRIVHAFPDVVVLGGNNGNEDSLTVSPTEPAVWVHSKHAAEFTLKLRPYLKGRAVEALRDVLAFRATEKVRDKRLEAKWAQLVRDEFAEHTALNASNDVGFSVDQLFCERQTRFQRRLWPVSEEQQVRIQKVVSRNVPVSTTSAAVSETTLLEKEDWVKVGEDVSRATSIKTHTDLATHASEIHGENEPVGTATTNEEEEEDVVMVMANPEFPDAPQSFPAPVDAKTKIMTMEEWVNRTPLAIRGEVGMEPWVGAGERIHLAARAYIVEMNREVAGRLVVTNVAIYFDPDPPGAAGTYFQTLEKQQETTTVDETYEPRTRFALSGIHRILLRRHRMMESGLELFFRGDGNKSVFLRFEDAKCTRRQVRDRVAKQILSLLPRNASGRSQHPNRSIRSLVEACTNQWQRGLMSNFEYIMELNLLAGRSVHDLCQYPVFPWVLSDYVSEELDLNNPSSFRDLSKPMGALTPSRLEEYIERYETFEDPLIPKFHYGSHYSTAAGVVLHFLLRLEPFRTVHVEMHDNRYDVPDRLFDSVLHSWESSSSSQDLGEVKELTPEFYYLPSAFENRGRIDFGTSQSGRKIDAVILPKWAHNSAQVFVQKMRQALESPHVSKNLHLWLDLIFGMKQRGAPAVEAHNVFFYLTYPGAVDLESMKDQEMRRAVEQQIAHFGQCPDQLESRKPWPERQCAPDVFHTERFVLRPRVWDIDSGFAVDREIPTVQVRVVNRKQVLNEADVGEEHDGGGGGGLLALRYEGDFVQLVRDVNPSSGAAVAGTSGNGNSVASSNTSVSGNGNNSKKVCSAGRVHSPFVWTSDGSLVIAASRASLGTLEFTNLGDGNRGTLFVHEDAVTCLAYDDGLLLTGAADGAIRLWKVGFAGAFRRSAVWTKPRRFLRGHALGEAIVCAAIDRSMGVVASASASRGLLVHDTVSGSLLFRVKQWKTVKQLVWDVASGVLLMLFANNKDMAVVSIDGTILVEPREGNNTDHDEPVVCLERIAPRIVCVSRKSTVELLALPSLDMLQRWPLPDVCAISPPPCKVVPAANSEFVFQPEPVLVNLVTLSRTVFVLRRSWGNLLSAENASGFSSVLRDAPVAVVGAVQNVVTSRVNLLGALDKVRTGVEVGKGVSGEAWEAAKGLFKN